MSNDDERKPRLHIHTGGLIILIIIVLILFKVDIKSKINSPMFQKNYTYIIDQSKIFWEKYISTPLKSKAGDLFIKTTNMQLEKIQNNFSENILKTPKIEEFTN